MHGQQREPPRSDHAASSGVSAYGNVGAQRAAARFKVAVVGAGFLGKCIAVDLSLLGVHVLVCDTRQKSADALPSFAYELLQPLLHLGFVTKSMVTQACSNITIVGDVAQCADASLVIEAIPEDLAAKVKLFQTLEQFCSSSTILATSTIQLSVDAIQMQLQNPGRFLGIRFFHPCVLLRPVEVTVGSSTTQNTVDRVVAFLQCIDKLPHRGPTKRVLLEQEISAFQFDTAVRGNFYHGLLEHERLAFVAEIITPHAGPPLVGPNFNPDTTSL